MKNYLDMMHDSIMRCSNAPKSGLTIPSIVMKYGIKFEPSEMPEKYKEDCGAMKECFYNSYSLAMKYPEEVIYCEGFAAKFFPVLHAWCMDRHTGELIEPTWEVPGTVYWGIPFRYDYIINRVTAGGFIENSEENYPMLTGEHPVKEWLEKFRR